MDEFQQPKLLLSKNWNTFYHVSTALVGQCLHIVEVSRLTDTPQSVGLLWTSDHPCRKDLYLTTHNTHKRQDIHATGGIRTRTPNKGLAVNPRLRPQAIGNKYKISVIFLHFMYFQKYDVWLTVYRNSVWIKKPTRCHFLYSLFLF